MQKFCTLQIDPTVLECAAQAPEFGGWHELKTNAGRTVDTHEGFMWINLPGQCTLVFEQTAM
jgi:hypothetical protein